MAVPLIDTHGFVKELVAAGFPEQQAEALANGLGKLDINAVATKNDLAQLETRLTNRMMAFHGVTVGVLGVLMTLLN